MALLVSNCICSALVQVSDTSAIHPGRHQHAIQSTFSAAIDLTTPPQECKPHKKGEKWADPFDLISQQTFEIVILILRFVNPPLNVQIYHQPSKGTPHMIMLQTIVVYFTKLIYAQDKLFLSDDFLIKDFNKLHKPPVSLDYQLLPKFSEQLHATSFNFTELAQPHKS